MGMIGVDSTINRLALHAECVQNLVKLPDNH